MRSVCFKEGINIDGDSLNSIIESSNHDVRQVGNGFYLSHINHSDCNDRLC